MIITSSSHYIIYEFRTNLWKKNHISLYDMTNQRSTKFLDGHVYFKT